MMSSKLRSSLVLSVFVLIGLGGVAVGADPKTSLGKWMKPSTGAPMASDTPDFATLQQSFGKLAGAPTPPLRAFRSGAASCKPGWQLPRRATRRP